jgi:hypothetical protein
LFDWLIGVFCLIDWLACLCFSKVSVVLHSSGRRDRNLWCWNGSVPQESRGSHKVSQ